MESKPNIVWITRGGNPDGMLWKDFIRHLNNEKFYISWVKWNPETENAEWWKATILPGIRHVVFHDTDATWVTERVASLKNTEFPDGVNFSIQWILESLDAGIHKKLPHMGINDISTIRSPFDELVLRLALREKEQSVLNRLKTVVKEQAVKDAKTETVIKQREEFLSVCAHDLRSPLGLIQSSLSMILNSKQPFPELHTELITRAKRQAGQAITLVNDLLDVMAFEQGLKPAYRLVTLHSFLSEFYKDYSFQAEQKNITFHYDNPIKEWRALIDPDRIRQLLQNLFTNALKFTESGKNIYLNVLPFHGRRKLDPPFPMVVVSVKDEGRGIPQNEMERIFDRFTQIKDYSRAEGRGLGLTVAKQISTLHDGNIWVQSVEGQGSTFFVLFPHVISRTSAEDRKNAKKRRILVVTPNEGDQDKYFNILGRWGYETVFAKDGIEAVTLAFHILPEAILTVADLAKMNAFEVFETLRNDPMTGNIPILHTAEIKLPKPQKDDPIFYDEFLKLPINREAFQIALDMGLKHLVERKRKKAA